MLEHQTICDFNLRELSLITFLFAGICTTISIRSNQNLARPYATIFIFQN